MQQDLFYQLRMPVWSLTRLKAFFISSQKYIFYEDPFFEQAVFWASPEIYTEYKKIKNLDNPDKYEQKIMDSLHRYYIRMCSRCTPYGYFAGWSLGSITDQTSMQTDGSQIRHSTRLDMNYMAELAYSLEQQSEIRALLLYYPNSSIYKVADRLRYVETFVKNRLRKYQLSAVICSTYLTIILDEATSGKTIAALASKIVDDEIDENEALDFIDQLINSQLLVSELEPSVTGHEFCKRLIKTIHDFPSAVPTLEALNSIEKQLICETFNIENYYTVWNHARNAIKGAELKDLIQTDLNIKLTQNTISSMTVEAIRNHVKKVWPIFDTAPSSELESFKKKFEEKYGDAEVPLLTALDPEFGIPYGPYERKEMGNYPLIRGVKKNTQPISTLWTRHIKLKHELLSRSMIEQRYEVDLSYEQIKPFEKTTFPIPTSYYIMGTLLSTDSMQVDNGDYRFLFEGAAGPSACNLMARFAHHDDELNQHIKEHLQKEQSLSGDVILAEISHLPEARSGNILSRPNLRNCEIIYLSNKDNDVKSITVQDLTICIQNDRIVIRSTTLEKEILPRLTTAHNFQNSTLPVYKFLCDLQYQGVSGGIAWNWSVFSSETFLPRIVFQSLILSPACWNIYSAQLGKPSDLNAFTIAFRSFSDTYKMPKMVCLVDDDNRLVLDINDPDCISLLYKAWCKQSQLSLSEFLQTENQCPLRGSSEAFVHELIIPCLNISGDPVKKIVTKKIIPVKKYTVGSEWLYLKVYSSISVAESILTKLLPEVLEEMGKEKLLRKWFFIRYHDSGHHLRLRFHMLFPEAWHRVITLLTNALEPLLNEGLIETLQTETYVPELNRYGTSLQVAENIFYADSVVAVNSLQVIGAQNNEQLRWQLALKSIDTMLDDLQFILSEKYELLRMIQQAFFIEFGGNLTLQRRLNTKYRKDSIEIKAALESPLPQPLNYILNDRSNMLKDIVPLLKESALSQQSYYLLVSDFLHMSINRLFPAEQRSHELVIYHYLQKYYESKQARAKNENKVEPSGRLKDINQ